MEVADDHVKTVDQAATCDVTCPLLREAVTVTQRDTGSVTRHGQCHGLRHVADIGIDDGRARPLPWVAEQESRDRVALGIEAPADIGTSRIGARVR